MVEPEISKTTAKDFPKQLMMFRELSWQLPFHTRGVEKHRYFNVLGEKNGFRGPPGRILRPPVSVFENALFVFTTERRGGRNTR
jgi:hypothetical protein